jgi:hypothetical protein
MNNILRTILFALLIAGATGLVTSCATDDPNDTDRLPWNLPQPWEGPLPSNLNNGR